MAGELEARRTHTEVRVGNPIRAAGIANDMDNCPGSFNPIRPLDNGMQADADMDGEGDVCDVCPLNADTDVCTAPDPTDRDGDGVTNTADNCPDMANSDQADADMDK